MNTVEAILISVVILAGIAGGHHYGAAGVQTKWNAAKLVQSEKDRKAAEVSASALSAVLARENATETRNKETADALQAKLDASDAVRRSLSVRLNAAILSAALTGALPKDPGKPDSVETGGTAGVGPLASAVADTLSECKRNADRLDALISEVEPQLF